ncbi:MAG: primosomal protein N' [Elusimicrobiota bacterium]|jgi:primosomal protein N' (replication factor Y)|nr:primosomal protein N' [Elusimicrobiota bacterium]
MNISVALPIALNKTFDYALPPALEPLIQTGLRVRVPFGAATQTGFITELNTNPKLPQNIKLKKVIEILDSRVFYGPDLWPLARFIEHNYANTLGETLNVLIPPFLNDKLLQNYKPQPPADLPFFYPAGPLTADQKNAFETAAQNQTTLFYGDTFTGKSEAVLNCAHAALSAGGQALLLVPDVIISAGLIERAKKTFGGNNIYMWHSKVPLSARKNAAADILRGRPCIVIGTRSAALLPFKNLKLAAILREEDEAFKQEDNKPYYHARDVLELRCKILGAKLILSSAAPSLETLFAAQHGKIKTVNFTAQIPNYDSQPQIFIAPKSGAASKYISDGLKETLHENMLAGGQSLVIMNRLGYSGALMCVNCRALAKCKKCGAVLSRALHKGRDLLTCKKCSAREPLEQVCPACRNEIFRPVGGGTQAAAQDLQKIFPQARIMRLDSQTLALKNAEGNYVAAALADGEADIVVGTQMALHAGLWEGRVNLIALLDADMHLNSPDFRAAEHFAQMLFNLKGRLKRFKNGRLIIQTSGAGGFDFTFIKTGEYLKFAEREAEFRREFRYPPFAKIVKIIISSKNQRDLDTFTTVILTALKTAYGAFMESQGPVKTGVQADNLRQQYLLVKSLDDDMLRGFLKTVAETKPPKQVSVKVIADPYRF